MLSIIEKSERKLMKKLFEKIYKITIRNRKTDLGLNIMIIVIVVHADTADMIIKNS